jgi:hypothetical protein
MTGQKAPTEFFNSLLTALLAVSMCASGLSAQVVPIQGLYPTGVDSSGKTLPLGQADPHYFVLESSAQAFVMTSIPGTYIPNSNQSLWIWENPNGQPTNVTRKFRITFDLTGFDESTAQIKGTWAVDNFGLDILVNGQSTGNMVNGFGAYGSFAVNSGFVEGINTLDFIAQDVGSISGFRVDTISGTVQVPSPGFSVLLTTLAFGALRRRR